jgi:hypothetical protein
MDMSKHANLNTRGHRDAHGGHKHRLILLPAAFSLILIAACNNGPAESEVTLKEPKPTGDVGSAPLRLSVVPGTVYVYLLEQDEEMQEYQRPDTREEAGTIETSIRAKLVRTCVDASDGVYQFVDKFEDVDIKVVCGGRLKGKEDIIRESRLKEFMTVKKLAFDERFRPISADGSRMSGSTTPYFPEGPLEPGQSWGGEVPDIQDKRDPAYNLQGMMPKLTFRYAGIDRIGDFVAVKIDTESTGSEAAMLDGPASSWFDTKSGMLVRFSATIKATAPQNIKTRILMDLQGVR